jgi:hypothetical protein
MTQIERRQARIRRIRTRNGGHHLPQKEKFSICPDVHHSIGMTQNEPEHIGLFVQRHAGDPAVKVARCDDSCTIVLISL